MSVLDPDLAEPIRETIETVERLDVEGDGARLKLGTVGVETETLENYRAVARTRGFSFETDEPADKPGGTDAGPRPLEYFLAGLAFCHQAQIVRNALLAGIEVEGLELAVEANVDPRGGRGVGDVPSGFAGDEIRVTVRLETPADPETVAEVVGRADEQCHARGALSRPMAFDDELVVNGEVVDRD